MAAGREIDLKLKNIVGKKTSNKNILNRIMYSNGMIYSPNKQSR